MAPSAIDSALFDDSGPFLDPDALPDLCQHLCQRLSRLGRLSCQGQWRQYLGKLSIEQVTAAAPWTDWELGSPNDRGHLAWAQGREVLWLVQEIRLSHQQQGYEVRGLNAKLALLWWAEVAEIFVNGRRVQEGDLFDYSARILLTEALQGGEVFQVAVRLVSPGHDPGALVSSELQFEQGADRLVDSLDPSQQPEPPFIAQELLTLLQYAPQDPQILQDLGRSLAPLPALLDQLAANTATNSELEASLAQIRRNLAPWGDWLKQRTIYLLGHAHLDLAWLWPIAETWDVAERTFRSVLNLQTDFPELIFGHSSPALYAWFQKHRPDLFEQVRSGFAAGSWEAIAGLWVEPDAVLSGGEALVRQVLYGQRYVAQFLGQVNRVAWLPDTFGFGWQLPQILHQGGIEWFLTQKLTWNDTNTFPHVVFHWQAPDGTAIPALMTASIGKGVDPLEMATAAAQFEQKTGLPISLWLPGVGDHGGGPTRDMLEQARRWQRSPLFPRLHWTHLHDYLDLVSEQIAASPAVLPHWDQDLYLELHRGCYTTHGDQKRYNRQAEHQLYEAELWASCATLVTGVDYPQLELEKAWKRVLFNQFHDILPGSSIPEVYTTANPHWEAALATAAEVKRRSLQHLTQAIVQSPALPPPPHPTARPWVVFNALAWDRTELVEVSGVEMSADSPGFQVYDQNQQALTTQISADGTLLFLATVPALGYALFWLVPAPSDLPTPNPDDRSPVTWHPETWTLANEYVQVTLDPSTGQIARIWDRQLGRSILSATGNQFQFFRDQGQYWDAWNIDPNYEQYPLESAQFLGFTVIEAGPLRLRVRGIWQFNQSRISQDYCLEQRSPQLRMVTEVDWQETYVLWKVAFPVATDSGAKTQPVKAEDLQRESGQICQNLEFTTEIACGAMQRPLSPQTPQEQAQWEVPIHRWADLSTVCRESPDSGQSWGVSLLNDSKYGCDARLAPQEDPIGGQLRLSLLRSPLWPNPQADRGLHRFTYALYSHGGTWQGGQTVRQGYGLNQPLTGIWADRSGHNLSNQPLTLPIAGSWLRLTVESPGLDPEENPQPMTWVPMALKRHEEDPQVWILRGYESEGVGENLGLGGILRESGLLRLSGTVNGLEQPLACADPDQWQVFPISPWQITSLQLRTKEEQ